MYNHLYAFYQDVVEVHTRPLRLRQFHPLVGKPRDVVHDLVELDLFGVDSGLVRLEPVGHDGGQADLTREPGRQMHGHDLTPLLKNPDAEWPHTTIMPFGSQNLIEACAVGAPVLLGPSVFNFSQAAELALACGAAWQKPDADQLVQAALQLLADEASRAAMGRAGREFAAAHRGATQRLLDYLLRKAPS